MRIPWSISLSENGIHITEFDVVIECEVTREYGEDEPSVKIEAIWVEESKSAGVERKVDLLGATSPGLAGMAHAEKERLESDGEFISQALDQSGWWRDGDARNPESKWRQAS